MAHPETLQTQAESQASSTDRGLNTKLKDSFSAWAWIERLSNLNGLVSKVTNVATSIQPSLGLSLCLFFIFSYILKICVPSWGAFLARCGFEPGMRGGAAFKSVEESVSSQ